MEIWFLALPCKTLLGLLKSSSDNLWPVLPFFSLPLSSYFPLFLLCVSHSIVLFSLRFVSSVPRPPCPPAGETTIVKASHRAWPPNWETYHGPVQSLQEVRGCRLLQCLPLFHHPCLHLYLCALNESLQKAFVKLEEIVLVFLQLDFKMSLSVICVLPTVDCIWHT